ncbi:MAG: sulfur reduction protein DsrE [Desulfobacteraceae bacterium]|nr:sulfur reduction protein DsrE [Desulfobacteraceae bacterium]
MENKVVVLLSCGTDNPNRATRAFFLAKVAHQEGKQASVFLLDEGVYLAREGIGENLRSATGDSLDDHLAYLQAHGVPIMVCTPCADSRRISSPDLIEGARFATGVELMQLISGAAVISL